MTDASEMRRYAAQCLSAGLRPPSQCRSRNFASAVNLTRQENTMRKVDGQVVETAVEARAGFLDSPVLVVLVMSVALALGALLVVYVGVF